MKDKTSYEGATPVARQRVSDQVFERLVSAILKGEFTPGDPLPTQRALASQFGVSPLLVRQAIHRLEELDLVRVRQGSITIVLDPQQSTDIRVLQHRVEAAAAEPSMVATVLEAHLMGALPLLVLAERFLTDAQVQELRELVDAVEPNASPTELQAFMARYWIAVAHATRNAFFQHQTRWWWRVAEDLRRRDASVPVPGHIAAVLRDYRTITAALAARSGSVPAYLSAIQPLLSWLDYVRSAGASGLAKAATTRPQVKPAPTSKPKRGPRTKPKK